MPRRQVCVRCPRCRQKSYADEYDIGRSIECAYCREAFRAKRCDSGYLVPVLVVGGIVAVLIVGFQLSGSRPLGSKDSDSQRMTREEFRRAVDGKKPDEVIARIGRPDSTQDMAGKAVHHDQVTMFWYYHGKTYDPVSGKTDRSIQVVFHYSIMAQSDVVDHVNFN